jgi:hypothetical protein
MVSAKIIRKLSIPFIQPLLVFFIPVNIYQNGNWIIAGIQWAFVRFQVTLGYGPSIIPITLSLSWVIIRILSARSAVSQIALFLAVIGVVVAFILLLSSEYVWIRKAGQVTI